MHCPKERLASLQAGVDAVPRRSSASLLLRRWQMQSSGGPMQLPAGSMYQSIPPVKLRGRCRQRSSAICTVLSAALVRDRSHRNIAIVYQNINWLVSSFASNMVADPFLDGLHQLHERVHELPLSWLVRYLSIVNLFSKLHFNRCRLANGQYL